MKPVVKKLSAILLSLAMVVSLTPFPGGLLLADETDAATPTAAGDTEPEDKKEPEKPAAEKPKESKKPAETAPKEAKETEAEAPKETEKQETEAPKEKETTETEAPKETEKPAEEEPAETVPETEAPAETEKPEAEQPKETEAPAETEKPAEETPAESEKPEEETPEIPEESTPGESENSDAKDKPIVESNIDDIDIDEKGVITWKAVTDATQYDISFLDHTYTVKTNSFEFYKEIDRLIKANEIEKRAYYYVYIYAYDSNGVRRAEGYDYFYYTSPAENTVGKLSATLKNGVLSWKAYANTTFYSIRIGSWGYLETNSLSINLKSTIDRMIEDEDIDKATDGKYEIRVSAINKYDLTIAKYETTFTYTSNATPIVYGNITNAKITNGVLTWDPYTGADYYYIELTSSWSKAVEKTSYNIGAVIDEMIRTGDLSKTGKYWVGISAYDKYGRYIAGFDGQLAYESTSEVVNPGQITDYSVSSEGILTWTAYEGASKYWIDICNNEGWGDMSEAKTNSFDLHKAIDVLIKNDSDFRSNDNKYTITIYADNTKGCTIASCTFTHTYDSKATPISYTDIDVTYDTDGTMYWDAVNKAAKYVVFVSDVTYEITSTVFDINAKINKLVSAGTIEKSSPYFLGVEALDSDGVVIGDWWGDYYYKSSSTAPKYGKIANVKSTNGILSWSKFKGATKYKLSIRYEDVVITTTSSNSVYLNDLLTKLINADKVSKYGYFDIDIFALNKKGAVIAKGYYDYNYLEPNTLNVTGKSAKAKRRKKTKISPSKLYNFIDKGQGRLTFSKVSGKKQFSVSKTTGKITVKKGLKKKTYTVKVRVAAAGRTVFAATTRTVTIKIKVK